MNLITCKTIIELKIGYFQMTDYTKNIIFCLFGLTSAKQKTNHFK